MEDPPEEVDVCTVDRLRREEVVRHEEYLAGSIRGSVFAALRDDTLEVLDDEEDGVELASEGYAYEALRVAYLRMLNGSELTPSIARNLYPQLCRGSAVPKDKSL